MKKRQKRREMKCAWTKVLYIITTRVTHALNRRGNKYVELVRALHIY